MINAKRIEEDLNKLARIGRIDSNNGLTRLAYSKEETKAHDYVKNVLKALSLETKKPMLPPNCANTAYYQSLGCKCADNICSRFKNDLIYLYYYQ